MALTLAPFAAEFPGMISSFIRLATAAFLLQAAGAADWPQWRGPLHTGHVPEGIPVPARLPDNPKVLWRVPVGDGHASPVVAAGKLFYLDHQAGKEVVHAMDASSGNEIWKSELDDVFKDNQTSPGPRTTPLVDEGRVYVQSCRGELQCLNAEDGKLLWRVNFVDDFNAVFIGERGPVQGASRHGYTGAPVIDGAHLIAGVGGTNGAGVVKFDKASGKVIWKSQNDVPGYAPPVIATVHGTRQVISFTVEGLIGLDLANGDLLWRVPIKTGFGRHATTPVVVDDMVVVSSHQVGLIGTKVSRDGAHWKAERAWVSKESAVNFASPVAVGNHLYGVGPARNLVCVEIPTGKQMWSQTGYFSSSPDKSHAAFVVMGENILVLTDGGELVLMEANPQQFREINRVQVSGSNWCNPAYANGNLFLRDARSLLAVELR
jgi:outer membrane protein assembly factor BamB